MTPVVVRRSAVKMWLLAILTVPFVLYGADVLLQQRFVGRVLELIHPNGEIPGIETRDIIWAWVFVLVGGAITGWALKELTLPRKLIEADDTALTLRVGGPFSSPTVIPWQEIEGVAAERVADDGDVFPVLVVMFRDGADVSRLPRSPWGARWIDGQRLALAALFWEVPVDRVSEALETLMQQRPEVRTDAGTADPGDAGAGAASDDVSGADLDPGAHGEGLDVSSAGGSDHWAQLSMSDGDDAAPARMLRPNPPLGRFAGSHWIILDEGD